MPPQASCTGSSLKAIELGSAQFSRSVVSNSATPWSSTPGFPVHHQLPELTQTHVRRSGINTIVSVFSQHMQGIASAGQLILPLLPPPLSPPYTPPEYSYVYAGSSKHHSSQADLLQPALGPSQVCDTEESASLAFRSQMVVLSVMCPRPNPQNL